MPQRFGNEARPIPAMGPAGVGLPAREAGSGASRQGRAGRRGFWAHVTEDPSGCLGQARHRGGGTARGSQTDPGLPSSQRDVAGGPGRELELGAAAGGSREQLGVRVGWREESTG